MPGQRDTLRIFPKPTEPKLPGRLRGKDYCNCEHAHMLRAAIQDAMDAANTETVALILSRALDADADAERDLWNVDAYGTE